MTNDGFINQSKRPKCKDYTNMKFGKLTAIKQIGFTKANKYGRRRTIWLCKCECGNYTKRTSDILAKGKSSCGCVQEQTLKHMSESNITHNMTHTKLYSKLKGMLNRCYRKSDIHYKSYGARGITVCDEWKNDYSKFFKWALNNGYEDGLSIERKDNDKGYCPENCTWIKPELQSKNKRQNIMITYNNKTMCASDWSKETGINAQVIRWRYKKGWNAEDIFKLEIKPLPPAYKEAENE